MGCVTSERTERFFSRCGLNTDSDWSVGMRLVMILLKYRKYRIVCDHNWDAGVVFPF